MCMIRSDKSDRGATKQGKGSGGGVGGGGGKRATDTINAPCELSANPWRKSQRETAVILGNRNPGRAEGRFQDPLRECD